MVEARRDGKRVIYKLADPEVVALLGALSRVTQRNVGAVEKVLNSYFRERDSLEELLRYATEVFVEQGYEGTRVRVASRSLMVFTQAIAPRALRSCLTVQ